MGWLDLGKPDTTIDVDFLFRLAEQKERLLRELGYEFMHGSALIENELRDLINACMCLSESGSYDCILKRAIDTLNADRKVGIG